MTLRLGVLVRNMGAQSTRELIAATARAADACPAVDDVWVVDHVAIPPDDAEGSGGRYLEPLATLAFLAGVTTRVHLGTAILVLPYRPPLVTAKWIATIQELSGGRLLLGVGVGWMEAEFRALGVDARRRGRLADATLAFLDRCFANDVVEANGQPFLFKPRPPRPPIFVGGRPTHAFRRALAHGAGWLPTGIAPDALRVPAANLRRQAADAGLAPPEVVVLGSLPLADRGAARDLVAAYRDAGATRVIHAERYAGLDDVRRMIDAMARLA
jgi:probable F420-dependent oxidoreductase